MISINLANNTFDDNYIEKINDNDVDYHFTDNWVSLYYNNVSGDADEYKKQGLKRWELSIYTHYTSNTDYRLWKLLRSDL